MQSVFYEVEMSCTKILHLPRHRCRNKLNIQRAWWIDEI